MTPAIKAPLLPSHDPSSSSPPEEKHGSFAGAIFNVSTSIVGAGIMSIPAAFKVLGVIPSLSIIVIIAWLSNVSAGFLMKSTVAGDATTYAGVMKESFGKPGSVAVQVITMVVTFGSMIIFSIIIGDVLSGNEKGGVIHLGLLQGWFGSHWWNTRFFSLLFIFVFLFLPLVLCRRVDRLALSSAISFLLALFFVIISSVLAIVALVQGRTKSPRLFPDLNNGGQSFFNLFTASPVIVTAFTFHFNLERFKEDTAAEQSSSEPTDPTTPMVKVETLEKGFMIKVFSGENQPGMLVSVLEAFEDMGLDQNEDEERMDAGAVKQAVTDAITSWGKTNVKVETLEKGFMIKVFSGENQPGMLVSVLEAFEDMGLDVLEARVSCTDSFSLHAMGVKQNEDDERMDAEAVKQAVTDAITSWGETNVPPFL
ncbi:hypothetical protein DY000_02035707 [Brassica cretica]|uniref:ACT domain-containing protein n=1 Tax=Brassica cretica TaxID=69181 RepID=A0ABQ7DM73_BRACR|nr:hypothetical protein DY000_02035707 [Brassica cretica]